MRIQGQVASTVGRRQPVAGGRRPLMIHTEPESVRPLRSDCGAPTTRSGEPSPVMSGTLASVSPMCWLSSVGKSTWK